MQSLVLLYCPFPQSSQGGIDALTWSLFTSFFDGHKGFMKSTGFLPKNQELFNLFPEHDLIFNFLSTVATCFEVSIFSFLLKGEELLKFKLFLTLRDEEQSRWFPDNAGRAALRSLSHRPAKP